MKKSLRPTKAPPTKKAPTKKKAPVKKKTPTTSKATTSKKAAPSKKAPTKQSVTFRLHAPQARSVHVAGTFCDWQPAAHPLRNGKQGVWTTRLALPPGRHEYRFIVDGVWHDDPQCTERVPNPFGAENCVLHVLHEMTQAERAKVGSESVA